MFRLVLALIAGLALRPAIAASHVEIENNWVRVLRERQEPHERDPLLQQCPPTVVGYLTKTNRRNTRGAITARHIRHKAGESAYSDAGGRAEDVLLGLAMVAVLI